MIIDMEHFVWMYILNNYFPTFLSPTWLTACLPSFVMTSSLSCSLPTSVHLLSFCLSLSVLFPSLPTYLYHPFLPAYLQHRNLSPFSLLSLPFCHPSLLSPCMPACFPAPSYFICSCICACIPSSPCLPPLFLPPFLTTHNCRQTLNDLGSCMASSDIIFLFNWILHCWGNRNLF